MERTRMVRIALLVGALAAAPGCLEMEAPDETGEVAESTQPVTWCPVSFAAKLDVAGSPDAGVGETPMILCGWENGWTDAWKSGVPKGTQSGWMKAIENQLELGDGFSTAPRSMLTSWYAILWSSTWGARWDKWDFQAPGSPGFAWVTSSSCSHPTSRIGAALSSTCSDVVTGVCQSAGLGDCCTSTWAKKCVDRAIYLGSRGGGNHAVTETGDPLPNKEPVFQPAGAVGGDTEPGAESAHTPRAFFPGGPFPGFLINPCAKKVCANAGLESCCTTWWTSACVQRAIEQCSATYLANPRVEQERVMTDICVEATTPGYTSCPFKPRTTASGDKECCHRAMVLEGVYQALDTEVDAATHFLHANTGRYVEWYRKLWVPLGFWQPLVNATLVSDPCDRLASGQWVCKDEVPKLWEVAGPGRPFYPDCSTGSGVRPCTCNNGGAPGRCIPAGQPHQGVELRSLLLAAASALVTTNGHYNIDIRWAASSWPGWNEVHAPLTYNTSFDGQPIEAMWHASGGSWLYARTFKQWSENGYSAPLIGGGNYRYWSDPFCYSSNTPQRSGTLLSSKVANCEVYGESAQDNLPNPPLITTRWKPPVLPPILTPIDGIGEVGEIAPNP